MTIQNKQILEETDTEKRTMRMNEMRATAADPGKARAFLMRTAMFEGLRAAELVN
jgi:3-(3-hydroxy-phenyl)propionate hydroxylase